MLVFEERGNRSTRRKPLGAEQRTNKLNPHMTPDLGIEPGPYWWEASDLTTAPCAIPASLCSPQSLYFESFSPAEMVHDYEALLGSKLKYTLCYGV